jgi:hypothetical protein
MRDGFTRNGGWSGQVACVWRMGFDISCYVLTDTIVNSTEHGVLILLDGIKVSFCMKII